MLYNPLAGPLNWFLQLYNMLPLPFRTLINLSFFLALALTVLAIFWRIKH